jgi:DNA ligase (NAD+)
VEEVGPEVAASVFQFFRDKKNKESIQRLKKAGVRLKKGEPARADGSPLAGQEFVITGT